MEEEKCDFISSLPSDILRRIISFLALEQAMKTSALSTVWTSLWVPVEVNLREANREVKDIVDLFSKPYDSHQVWKLCLSFQDSKKAPAEMKGEIIALAAKGVDEELYLDFSERQKEQVKNLCLKLEPCCSCHSLLSHPSQAATFSSTLKMLHVRRLSNLSKDLISGLFSSSQFLESLKLEGCNGLQSLDIEANHFLRSLKVIDCPDMVNISVSAINLRSFWYQGILPHQVHLKNTSDLVEVMFDLRNGSGPSEFDCEDVLSLLASLKDIEVLRVSGWLLEWLCSGGVIFRRLDINFNKLKQLSWMDSAMDNTKRDSLACFLNICPSLEKLIIEIDPNRGPLPCPYFHHYWHEPHLWMDYTSVMSNTSQLENLKVVEFMGYTNEEDQSLLIDLLLKKACLLESVTVTSPQHHSWKVAKIPDDQSQLNQTWQSSNQQKQNAVLSLIKFIIRIQNTLFTRIAPSHKNATP
ncbi:hypothetical protein POUND7_001937 [Theobroma cacao]